MTHATSYNQGATEQSDAIYNAMLVYFEVGALPTSAELLLISAMFNIDGARILVDVIDRRKAVAL